MIKLFNNIEQRESECIKKYGWKAQAMKNRGFTILELMGVIAFVSFFLLFGLRVKKEISNTDDNNVLATQAQNYSKIAINYIQKNYKAILQQSTINPIYITFSQLASAGYLPSGQQAQNALGQIPCIYISYRNNHIEPLLFFVNTPSTKTNVPFTRVKSAELVSMIGAAAGFIENNGDAISIGNTWRISGAQSLLNPTQCLGTSIARYSLLVNLGLLSEFNTNTESDGSVYRILDSNTPFGSKSNYNTLQADISLHQESYPNMPDGYNSIYIGNNIRISATSYESTGVTIQNGDFQATNIIPSGSNPNVYNGQNSLVAGTKCNSEQQGAMASQNNQVSSGQLISNQLQCQYNVLLCQGTDPNGAPRNGYCFIPIQALNLNVTPNIPDAFCPAGYFTTGSTSVSNICSCPVGGTPTSGTYIQYDTIYAGNLQVNRGAYGRCNCNNGTGRANITSMTCSSLNPAITYSM